MLAGRLSSARFQTSRPRLVPVCYWQILESFSPASLIKRLSLITCEPWQKFRTAATAACASLDDLEVLLVIVVAVVVFDVGVDDLWRMDGERARSVRRGEP